MHFHLQSYQQYNNIHSRGGASAIERQYVICCIQVHHFNVLHMRWLPCELGALPLYYCGEMRGNAGLCAENDGPAPLMPFAAPRPRMRM